MVCEPSAPIVDVLVIGAGQAGLSAAAHLRRAGFRTPGERSGAADRTLVVVDASAGPGGAWRDRWASLTMRTVNGIYQLPGREVPEPATDRPARDVLPAYFAQYEDSERLAVQRPVQVTRVVDGGDGLLTVTGWQGGGPDHERVPRTWRVRALVNATGTWTRPFWPVVAGAGQFRGRQLHTHDYRGAEEFAGQRVLVVGGGLSAVQHLLEIHPVAATTTWVTRRPPEWTGAEFGPEAGRAAVARVADRTRAGLPPQSVVAATGLPMTAQYQAGIESGVLVARPPVARLAEDAALWDGPAVSGPLAEGWVTGPARVPVDVVLWATGFRPALEHLAPLRLRRAGGGIAMDGTRVAADARIHLIGYGPSASTVGANRAGRAAAAELRRLLAG